jgi:hypothetical protein
MMADRDMNIGTFAQAAGLSGFTAARLVKKGELPGRQSTHQKLRTLLGLGEADYELLLARSRQIGDQPGSEPTMSTPVTAVHHAVTAASAGHDDGGELMALIARLTAAQRRALHQFLLALTGP